MARISDKVPPALRARAMYESQGRAKTDGMKRLKGVGVAMLGGMFVVVVFLVRTLL